MKVIFGFQPIKNGGRSQLLILEEFAPPRVVLAKNETLYVVVDESVNQRGSLVGLNDHEPA